MLWFLSSSPHQLLNLRFPEGLSLNPWRGPGQELNGEITVGDKLLEIQDLKSHKNFQRNQNEIPFAVVYRTLSAGQKVLGKKKRTFHIYSLVSEL